MPSTWRSASASAVATAAASGQLKGSPSWGAGGAALPPSRGAATNSSWRGFGPGPAQPKDLQLAGDPPLGILEAALQTPAIGDHGVDRDAPVRDLDQEIDDAQRLHGLAERAAVDAHPLERRRFELEADLARRCARRRPRIVALADRLRQALQTPLLILGGIERGLQAFHCPPVRLQALGFGGVARQRGLGGGGRLGVVLRCTSVARRAWRRPCSSWA